MYCAWQAAFRWLCRQRKHLPAGADIWHLRWQGEAYTDALFQTVVSGRYRLSPMFVAGRRKEAPVMWSAEDALVLKWVSLLVQAQLPQHDACMHLKGRGVRAGLRQVSEALNTGQYRFEHRTDIHGYYEHIRKGHVLAQINLWVTDPVCRDLIRQFVHYSVEYAGIIRTPEQGIPRGCPLSPLIGGSLLHHIDGDFRSLKPEEMFYVRYMDDFLLLTRTRWQLRRGIARLVEHFTLSGFEKHPDKTQTGRVEKGFDWTGVWFGPAGPAIAPRALNNHRERRMRLYEQARWRGLSHEEANTRVRAYEARWKKWADGLLQVCSGSCPDEITTGDYTR